MKGIQTRYTENVRNTIPTCWPLINDLAGGGFGKGELIITLQSIIEFDAVFLWIGIVVVPSITVFIPLVIYKIECCLMKFILLLN